MHIYLYAHTYTGPIGDRRSDEISGSPGPKSEDLATILRNRMHYTRRGNPHFVLFLSLVIQKSHFDFSCFGRLAIRHSRAGTSGNVLEISALPPLPILRPAAVCRHVRLLRELSQE